MKFLVIVLVLVASLSISCSTHAARWVCMKDGKNVNVQGETDENKKAACEADKGTWTEEKQSAGKGAGW